MWDDLIDTISADKLLDDELFLTIIEIKGPIDKQKLIEAAWAKCRKERKLTEFNNMLKVWNSKQAQIVRAQGSKQTQYTDAPLVLNCGEWEATDADVYKLDINTKGELRRITPHTNMELDVDVTGVEPIPAEFSKKLTRQNKVSFWLAKKWLNQ